VKNVIINNAVARKLREQLSQPENLKEVTETLLLRSSKMQISILRTETFCYQRCKRFIYQKDTKLFGGWPQNHHFCEF
jgi:hypothetical protein